MTPQERREARTLRTNKQLKMTHHSTFSCMKEKLLKSPTPANKIWHLILPNQYLEITHYLFLYFNVAIYHKKKIQK